MFVKYVVLFKDQPCWKLEAFCISKINACLRYAGWRQHLEAFCCTVNQVYKTYIFSKNGQRLKGRIRIIFSQGAFNHYIRINPFKLHKCSMTCIQSYGYTLTQHLGHSY
ncbi:hypothetical protein FKM82_000165 [Ascaphus truei]